MSNISKYVGGAIAIVAGLGLGVMKYKNREMIYSVANDPLQTVVETDTSWTIQNTGPDTAAIMFLYDFSKEVDILCQKRTFFSEGERRDISEEILMENLCYPPLTSDQIVDTIRNDSAGVGVLTVDQFQRSNWREVFANP